MPKIIEKRVFPRQLPCRKRVAAYARVSSAKDAMHHSLSAQVSYYSQYIQSRPEWQYIGVYADEAKTGTKDNREQFQRLLTDCRSGKVDMVITKSISRFARNTVTLLETIRELKGIGVDVFFEEQNIHTASADGELMLSILASFAQAESQSASENQRWRVKKKFEEGRPWNFTMLGYRCEDGKLTVKEDEAVIVRRIFREYLSGKGFTAIANGLNADGIPTRFGNPWRMCSVSMVLSNYTYTGNLLLQKTFRGDYLSKCKKTNHGELPMYHAVETHEPIIDMDTFELVQEEMKRRSENFISPEPSSEKHDFTDLVVCSHCGKHYRRKSTHGIVKWVCRTYDSRGKSFCPSKAIPEEKLYEMLDGIDLDAVENITAQDGNTVRIRLKNGLEIVRHWKNRSRAESWTDEMREQARQKMLKRRKRNGSCDRYPCHHTETQQTACEQCKEKTSGGLCQSIHGQRGTAHLL